MENRKKKMENHKTRRARYESLAALRFPIFKFQFPDDGDPANHVESGGLPATPGGRRLAASGPHKLALKQRRARQPSFRPLKRWWYANQGQAPDNKGGRFFRLRFSNFHLPLKEEL
jgi:hypothetical protein